ncbi:aminoglycoside phosphotransferase [Actinoplanes sp. NPDC051861]|uniref:aminoglycoside phosphotransferase n=1 Tax=Actinoplanes sp. NPDC051861 TaxID=3155170 RepID=UPI00342BA2E9
MIRRPRLSEAPAAVRSAVAELLGSPLHAEHPAAAGFTRSIASVVIGTGGERLFIKAAPTDNDHGETGETVKSINAVNTVNSHDKTINTVNTVNSDSKAVDTAETVDSHSKTINTVKTVDGKTINTVETINGDGKTAATIGAVEAGALLAGHIGDLGPRLVGFIAIGDWRIAAYEVIDGEPVTRWTDADRFALRAVMQRMHHLMEPCPTAGTSPYAVAFLPLLGTWQALNGTPATLDVDHIRGLPTEIPIPVLAGLESRWLPALIGGNALHHGDLRRDNFVRQPDGRLRIVDWTHLWTAPGWMDLVRLAPDLAACGHDPEQLLRDSPWHDAPGEHVDVALAGLAGRAWREGLLPEVPELPGLRSMQREQAVHLLKWLGYRLRSATRRAP